MKKQGFTLAELLISLAIIAVIAAITAPIFNNIKPDKYKIKVLNYYAAVTEAVNSLLEDNTIYYTTKQNGQPTCFGLSCTGQPITGKYNSATYSGGNKFRNLMIDKLGIDAGTMTDSSGTVFDITQDASGAYYITVDLSNKGNDCVYDVNNCPHPDRFSFRIGPNGSVTPGDALTYAYLQNATSRDKKADYAIAAQSSGNFTNPGSGNSTSY